MRFQSRDEALHLLGLDGGATEEQIKTVYRMLAKQYHPDGSGNEDTLRQFYDIRDAYEYLTSVSGDVDASDSTVSDTARMNRWNGYTSQENFRTPHIFGEQKNLDQASWRRHLREENARKEKRHQQAQKERQEKYRQQMQQRYKIEQENRLRKEKQDREYREAMEKINIIRTARAIETILQHYKEEGDS